MVSRKTCAVVAAVGMLFLMPGSALPDDLRAGSGYRLTSSVVGVGGCPGEAAGKRSNGTVGQPSPVGVGAAGGKVLYSGFWECLPLLGGVEDGGALEDFIDVPETRLFQNTPNPFNPLTTVEYSVREEGSVGLAIFSVEGEHVRTLVREYHGPGLFSVVWDGTDEQGQPVSSGVYFYRMTAKDYSEVRKMLILK